jgi:hypothetical protein
VGYVGDRDVSYCITTQPAIVQASNFNQSSHAGSIELECIFSLKRAKNALNTGFWSGKKLLRQY